MGIPEIANFGIQLIAPGVKYRVRGGKRSRQEQSDEFGANDLEDFNVTSANEGKVVKLLYGRTRNELNIIAYKNLLTQTTFDISGGGGGKGGSSSSASSTPSGFRYFLDIWYALGLGKLDFTRAWVNNQEIVNLAVFEPLWTYVALQFNDGENGVFPTIFDGNPGFGAFTNAIPGVSHLFFHWYLLGENVSSVSTLHLLLERELVTPLSFPNMASGSNPASAVYDLLRRAGVVSSQFDVASFEAASVFWNTKEYGINVAFTKLSTVQSLINQILGLLDATVAINTEGKYVLKYRDPLLASSAHITDDFFIDLSLRRVTYTQVPNDFKATFKDKDQEYTDRTINVQNQAAINLNGNIVTESIDMRMFDNVTSASRRLIEIMKNLSFPLLECQVTTYLTFSELLPGDKVTLTNAKFGVSGADFWITEVSQKDLDKNLFSFKAIQVTETLFDDIFFDVGGTETVPVAGTMTDFANVKVFELPYTSTYGFEPAFLFLVQRNFQFETGFDVLASPTTGGPFTNIGGFATFSQHGATAELYPITHEIDNDNGILYTPTINDPTFDSISESQLYTTPRFALIGGTELVAFQTVTPEGGASFRLTGVIRGILNTPVSSHILGAEIWLTTLGLNVIQSALATGTFFHKVIPTFAGTPEQVFDPTGATERSQTTVNTAKIPRIPSYVTATRTGSSIALSIFPNTPDVGGTGDGIPENVTDSPSPFPFIGELLVEYDAAIKHTLQQGTTEVATIRAGAVTITIKHRRDGFTSGARTVFVAASDGFYHG